MRLSVKADFIFREGRFVEGEPLEVDSAGRIVLDPTHRDETAMNGAPGVLAVPTSKNLDVTCPAEVRLARRAVLPGFLNVHSHGFQRLIRGRAESRAVSGKDFWSWRGTMYHAALRLSPEDLYDVARMAFLEMVKAGTTTVGEFHYLHRDLNGKAYADGNLLAKQVIEAARSVGIRIVMLRSAYLRSGFDMETDPGQKRFFETGDEFLRNMEALMAEYAAVPDEVGFGVAPHSIRAVPIEDLREIFAWARRRKLPIHMHVAEQVRENDECEAEHGRTPVEMLAREGLLGPDLTAVHAIQVSGTEIAEMARAGVRVCSCPTTERNLGDGTLAAGTLMEAGITLALGSDSQAQIDPMEDARELDYHLRLERRERAVLDMVRGETIASRLFTCATRNGARSLAVDAGELNTGMLGDFVAMDLNDLSIAGSGAGDLLSRIVFGMQRGAVKEVAVNGRVILREGRHELEEEIVEQYKRVSGKVWS